MIRNPRQAEQDRNGGRTGVAAEGHPGRNGCGYQSQASDRGEDTEFANERALGEILDHVAPVARSVAGSRLTWSTRVQLAVACKVSHAR